MWLAVALQAGAYAYVRYIEPNWIQVSRVTVREGPLLETLRGSRIVHITDLHIERLGVRERSLIRLVNAQQPDWIVMTGDFINAAEGWPVALEVVRRLRAAHGVFAVPGNTDNHFLTPAQFEDGLASIGVTVLRNRAVLLGETGAWLVGVDDPVHDRDRLPVALAEVAEVAGRRRQGAHAREDAQPSAPVILLAHAPEIMQSAVPAGIPLVLVGHTHGGQLGIPWLRRLSRYAERGPYVSGGSYRVGPVHLYVNRGIGSKVLPYRFLAPPEVAVITFQPSEAD